MARTSNPHSATNQFFINVADNSFLDYPGQDGWGYCVFGRVTEGMDTVEKIKGVSTGSRHGHQDVLVGGGQGLPDGAQVGVGQVRVAPPGKGRILQGLAGQAIPEMVIGLARYPAAGFLGGQSHR